MNIDYSFDPNDPNSSDFLKQSGYDQASQQALLGLQGPSHDVLDPAATALAYRQRGFDAKQGLVQDQADNAWQDTADANYNDYQAGLEGLTARGLVGTPMGDAQMAALERRNAARGGQAAAKKATAGEDFQLQTMSHLRDMEARRGMQEVDREFQAQMREYQRTFAKLQQTTEWKIADDVQRRDDQLQADYRKAQDDIMSSFEKSTKDGGLWGGILGGAAGLVGGLFTGNPMLAWQLAQAGYNVGHGVGTAAGSGAATPGMRATATAFRQRVR